MVKRFARFAKRNGMTGALLKKAAADIENGKFSANLGGGVYKQRISREGRGKSGGYHVIVLLKRADRAFFVYGFAKSERANISEREENEFKKQAKIFFAFSDEKINVLLQGGALIEIRTEDLHEQKI